MHVKELFLEDQVREEFKDGVINNYGFLGNSCLWVL